MEAHPGWEVWVRRRGCMLIRIIVGMGGIGTERGKGIERGTEKGIGWWWLASAVVGASGWTDEIG